MCSICVTGRLLPFPITSCKLWITPQTCRVDSSWPASCSPAVLFATVVDLEDEGQTDKTRVKATKINTNHEEGFVDKCKKVWTGWSEIIHIVVAIKNGVPNAQSASANCHTARRRNCFMAATTAIQLSFSYPSLGPMAAGILQSKN